MQTIERLSLPEEGHYEWREILENIKKNDGVACFEMSVDCHETDIGNLNDSIDTVIESGWMLGDICYEPLRVQNGEIVFEVQCGETQEWVEEFKEEHLGDGE